MIHLKAVNFMARGQYCHVGFAHMTYVKPPEPHRHDFHELFWVYEGRGIHWINGEKRELRPGLLAFIRAADSHTFCMENGGFVRKVNVAFHCETWNYVRRRYCPEGFDYFGRSHAAKREFQLSPGELAEMQRLGVDLRGTDRSRLTIERFLLNVVFLLRRAPTAQTAPLPEWLERARREIAEKRHFAGGTGALAQIAGKTAAHVARETRRLLGVTPTDLVNEARLSYAAGELSGSNRDILDICLDCGFENLGHFYRLFRRKFHTSPRLYRLQQQRIVGGRT